MIPNDDILIELINRILFFLKNKVIFIILFFIMSDLFT